MSKKIRSPAVPVPASRDRAGGSCSPGADTGLRIARGSRPWGGASRAPETQPAALVLSEEVLGTDLVGIFSDQPSFAFDPRRPYRPHRIVSIGDADKGAGRVVDDDQGLERDQRSDCEQLLQVVDGARQGVVEVDVERVEVEQVEEFEPAGRMVGEGFQVEEAVADVDVHPLADQGAAKGRRLGIAVDRKHRRAGVEFGVSVEQDRALAVARPVVLLPHAASLDNPNRPVEAVEIVKYLTEALFPMTELRPSDLVEPAPEIGRPHGCCSGNGFDGRRPALGGAIKPEPERSALCLTVSVLGSLRNRIVRFCGQIKNPSRVHVRVPSAFGDFRLGGSTQRQAGLTRWGGACRHLIGETRRRAVDAEKFDGALIKSARIAGRFRTGPAANAPAPSSKTASPNRPTRAWPTRQPGPRPRSPPLAFDTGRP